MSGEHVHDPELEESTDESPPQPPLDLTVEITDVGPCKKHLKVQIAHADVERQFDESLGTLKKEAAVPGFRPGRAPRNLVQKRFRKEVGNQVKSTLVMSALEQIDENYKLNPISQPSLDIEAIELPEDGPLQFEMDVEVRPEFELPGYQNLSVKRPLKSISDADVDVELKRFLERYAQLVPKLEGGAVVGDFITADLIFERENGERLNEAKEIQFRLQEELRFQDGHVPNLRGLLEGVAPGESRVGEAKIGSGSPDPSLRGQTIRVTFVVNDLKIYRLPEANSQFLASIGFSSLDEIRDEIRKMLERRFESSQREAIRNDLMSTLIEKTPFDLPADLVQRQETSTLRRLVLELRQGGMSEDDIKARAATIRANAHESTLRSLKEFFILAKIADAEGITVEDEDIEDEINLIARRSDESPRRVRARIQKEDLGDAIASQILERKTIDRILESATFTDVALAEQKSVETLDNTAGTAVEEEAQPEAAASADDSSASEVETPA